MTHKHTDPSGYWLTVNAWLANRYAIEDKHGRRWLTRKRNGKPTRYAKLERAFFDKYVMNKGQ